MTVLELRKHLESCPDDDEVGVFWDGGVRGGVDGIFANGDREIVIVGHWCIYEPGISLDPTCNIIYSKNEERDDVVV